MLTNKKTCKLAVHFNCIEHDISEISFIVIEKIASQGDATHIDRLLLTREDFFKIFSLQSLEKDGPRNAVN